MARAEAMAQIDTVLATPATKDNKPVIAPPPVKGLTPEKAQKKAEEKLEKEEKERLSAEKEQIDARLKAEKEQAEQQQEAEKGLLTQAQNAGQMALDLLKNAQSAVSKLPSPGGIMFPFAILLIFFFLLLPVNGHTRAMWLWLVLTGQASIAPLGGGASGDFNNQGNLGPGKGPGDFSALIPTTPTILPRSFTQEDYL